MAEQLLTLAYSLAVLTYYLGALIYLLPIPWRGLKRWGPTLVYDGWASAALASCFYLILQVIGYIYEVLGASWDSFTSWTIAQAGKILALIGGAALVKRVIGGVIGVIVGDILSPLMWALGSTLFALELLLVIGEAVRASYTTLIALGIMLYAVPFRITRGVGSGLIAFTIVFYICLPLLPAFVESIASPPNTTTGAGLAKSLERLDVAFVRGRLLDGKGEPVPGALLVFRRLSGEEIAAYVTGEDGWFDAGRPRGGLPLNEPFAVEAHLLGLKLPVTPNPVDPSSDLVYSPLAAPNAEYTLELRLVNAQVVGGEFLVVGGDGVEIVNASVGEGQLTVSAVGSGRLVVVTPPGVNVTSCSPEPASASTLPLPGGYRSLKLEYNVDGVLGLTLTFEKVGSIMVQYTARPMLEGMGRSASNILEDVGREVSRMFFAYFLLPMGYLGVLSFVSASLARVIGGAPPKIPVRW